MSVFVEHYPHPHHPLVVDDESGDLVPDMSRTVEVFQLRPGPGDVDRMIVWAGVWGYPGASGGAALMLPGTVHPTLVELGDFVIRDGDAMEVLPASAGVASRFVPAAA